LVSYDAAVDNVPLSAVPDKPPHGHADGRHRTCNRCV